MAQPKRSAVLLRSQGSSTARAHPLNRGVVGDFEAACQQGLLRPEAQQSGVLYWLGLCQAIMTNIVERRPSREDANRRLAEMLVLGLTGLGIDAAEATRLARLKA